MTLTLSTNLVHQLSATPYPQNLSYHMCAKVLEAISAIDKVVFVRFWNTFHEQGQVQGI